MPQVADVKEVRVQTQGFGQGVNLQDAPNLLAPTEVRRAENGSLDERGGFTKRLGCLNMGTVGAGADRIISAYTYYRGYVQPQVLIHTTAGKVYTTTDPTANPIVWTQIATGYSTVQPMSWETFNSKVYFCDGVSPYSSWDGTTLATYPSAPVARYLRLWKDTMWSSGITNLPDRVYSSAAGDAETWPVANWIDIRKGDGDTVRALGTDGVYLIIGKRNSGSLIYDPALFFNRVFDYEKGIESHWSVIQHESNIFYLTRRGIAQWQGDSPASLISYKIDPMFNPAILNADATQYCWAYAYGQRVSWAMAEVGSIYPTIQVNYYPRLAELTALGVRGLGPWSIDRMPIICAINWRWQTTFRLLGGSNQANKFYWLFADSVGQDDGQSFVAILETGAYDFGDPLLTKYIRRMRILGRGRLNVQLRRNFLGGIYYTKFVDLSAGLELWNDGSVWNDGSMWGPDSNVKETTVNPDAYGRFFALIFSDNDPAPGNSVVPLGTKDYVISTGQWSILGIVIDGSLLGVRNT
jgi:hypothetical protein